MNQPGYWDKAGDASYRSAMYRADQVADHVLHKMWKGAMDAARVLSVPRDGRIMDLGCGDGAFTKQMLAPNFCEVEGFELSEQAVARASDGKPANTRFTACDVEKLNYASLGRYDAVFMIGILHHVKWAAQNILTAVAGIADRVIMVEPNGNHLVRKLLEKTPSYKAAGEDSFRRDELFSMCRESGFDIVSYRPMNLFPNFTPAPIFRLCYPLEPLVERTPLLHGFCTNRILALKKSQVA